MRLFPTRATTVAALAAAFLAVCIAATGCTPARPSVVHVVPKHTVTDRHLVSYPGIRVRANVTYATADGHALRLDVCLPRVGRAKRIAPRPTILVIHGGGWAAGDKSQPDWRNVCEWLASTGYVTASVDYRLAPAHVYPAGIRDVEHAVEWLRAPAQVTRFAIDPTLIGAFGGSAGGNLAALLGTTGSGSLTTGHRVAAVADFSGPTNLTVTGQEETYVVALVNTYLGCRTLAECPSAVPASPLYDVDQTDPPFFIANSTKELIPLSQATSFVNRLRASNVPVTFVTITGDEHSITTLDAAMRARVLDFFAHTLVHVPFDGLAP